MEMELEGSRASRRRAPERLFSLLLVCAAHMIVSGELARGAEPQVVQIAGGKMSVTVPGDWQAKQPGVRIIEQEYWAPAAEGDGTGGRLTMMAAGGSVTANIDRWKGQFELASETPPRVEKLAVAGMTVHFVDLAGTYKDQAGPFAPAQLRDNYRMLGAVVEMKTGGLYFLKFYGPEATIGKHAEPFRKLVEGLTVQQ